MPSKTGIEWTEVTWNPVTGCTKVSPGCKHCYAERMAKRIQAMGHPRYKNGFSLTLHDDLVQLPLTWVKPRLVFVNSMSDLFHEEVPIQFIRSVFETMAKATQHTFQILTKRATRLVELASHLPWPSNVWMGVSVENQQYIKRIDQLREIPSSVRFLSLEPLLGPLNDLNLNDIHWVIVGGESGPGARPVDVNWVRSIRDQCLESGVPFFFKQWGGVHRTKAGRLLDGKTWEDYPIAASSTAANV